MLQVRMYRSEKASLIVLVERRMTIVRANSPTPARPFAASRRAAVSRTATAGGLAMAPWQNHSHLWTATLSIAKDMVTYTMVQVPIIHNWCKIYFLVPIIPFTKSILLLLHIPSCSIPSYTPYCSDGPDNRLFLKHAQANLQPRLVKLFVVCIPIKTIAPFLPFWLCSLWRLSGNLHLQLLHQETHRIRTRKPWHDWNSVLNQTYCKRVIAFLFNLDPKFFF